MSRNSVVKLIDRPGMTIVSYLGRKAAAATTTTKIVFVRINN